MTPFPLSEERMTWPTPREIPSIPGVAYTVEAGPHLGTPWLFFYRYLEVAA